MYAFALTAYDDNQESIEDPSIGILKPYYKSWGLKDDSGEIDFELLPTRNCTQAELHINGESDPESLFYEPHPSVKPDLVFYYKKLKCLDMESIKI